jgi:hypothetical protein
MRRLFVGIGLVLFVGADLHGQEVPNASQVAGKTGEAVVFQDEVKAVSYSKSTKGYYLSFGEPYPKQVLSVWIDAQIYDHLAFHHSMVGRTVHINGQIEASPTGPVMKLESSNQFKVMPTDEAILSKPTLDGKQEREQFRTAVLQTFQREDFDTLETLGRELQQSHERLADGSWLSEAFFSALRLPVSVHNERYATTGQILAHWEQAKPGSTILPLVKAGYHLDLAWEWRGNGYGNTVTPEGWHGFKEELAKTRQILDGYQLGKLFPEYFALMLTVALGEGWSRERYERLFDEATRAEPDYYGFYFQKAHYLLPRWHGKKGEWEQFAEQERQKHGAGGAGDALYARIAWSMRDYYENLFRDANISWEVTASGFEYLIRQYPGSRYLKSLYANLCWKTGDRARLRKALPEIKSDPDMTVWVNLENVALAEKFAGTDPSQ